MDRLELTSHDVLAENIAYLAERFPNVITAATASDGSVTQAVDWEALRQEFADRVVDGARERYQLTWPGKREAVLATNAPTERTLRPDCAESVEFDTTQNLFD